MTITINLPPGNIEAAGWLAAHLGLDRHLVNLDGKHRDAWDSGFLLREQTIDNYPPGGWGGMRIAVVLERRD